MAHVTKVMIEKSRKDSRDSRNSIAKDSTNERPSPSNFSGTYPGLQGCE